MSELTYLKILYTIRENNNCVSLNQLSSILGHPHRSYKTCDFHPLIDLCIENYITILNSNKEDITKFICETDYDKSFKLLCSHFYSDENGFLFKLTDKLPKIQSLLGFSLTDTIIKYSENFSFVATPAFNKPDFSLQNDVFVIMPFQKEFNYLYENYIKKACKCAKVSCIRADDLYASRPIMQDIWSLIYNSKVIIADCTNKNPNVMYELGIAHAIGKDVILITQNIDDIPFDLRHLRHLHYEYTPHSIEKFEDDLTYALYPFIDNSPH